MKIRLELKALRIITADLNQGKFHETPKTLH